MPSRRAYLGTLAAAGIAGCVGTSPGSTTDSQPDMATTTSSTLSRPAVTIEAVAVQYAYRHIEQVEWNAIQTADGQFVFVTVDASETDPVPDREVFTLATGDGLHDPIETDEYRYLIDLDVPGEPYTPRQEGAESWGWLMFEVPAQLDTAPSLRLEDDSGSWEWELDTEKATAPPPTWEWTAGAPETIAPDETFDITVTAENVGDGPGTFRGAVNFSYPMYRHEEFNIALDSGESDVATVSVSSEDAEPGRELEYDVRTPAGKTAVAVNVETASTSAEDPN